VDGGIGALIVAALVRRYVAAFPVTQLVLDYVSCLETLGDGVIREFIDK
jgi:hypothetical protein